jgi:hypothetical protein
MRLTDQLLPDPAPAGPPQRKRRPLVRWNLMLVWFMRLMALLWIFKGLMAWSVIIGVMPTQPSFENRLTGFQATTIYFAIIDLVAAIGLWLTSTWGGVLWLLAIVSHLILAFFFPAIVTGGMIANLLYIVFIVVYLAISWLAVNQQAA